MSAERRRQLHAARAERPLGQVKLNEAGLRSRASSMESAGATLVKGDLRGIAKARHLSRATMSNICQNLFFAFVYRVIGIPIASGVLYSAFGRLLSPIIASAAMSLSSVSVLTNALRLRRVNL
jgi:Cu+-exporting ATPase